jgi:hypothetical protein
MCAYAERIFTLVLGSTLAIALRLAVHGLQDSPVL